MKLISLNVEGKKHFDKVFSFLEREDPEVVCLQEAPIDMSSQLRERGYKTTFLPLTVMPDDNSNFPQGNLFASRLPYVVDIHHYHQSFDGITLFDFERKRETMSKALIFAKMENMLVATTHFTWAPDGAVATENQIQDMKEMMDFLDKKPPHILCGDLNIPRNINRLYEEEISPRYTDAIPEEYKSSLDRNFHRLGNDPEKDILFNDFMVDYLLLKEPYIAENVRLEFGVSDHAAIVGDIKKG